MLVLDRQLIAVKNLDTSVIIVGNEAAQNNVNI